MNHKRGRKFQLFPQGMPKSKRLLDLFLVLVSFPFWFVLWGMTALIVWLKIGRPILFLQVRQGYKGRPFMLMKFRTMTDERDAGGALKKDEERLGKTGALLRSLSLDELPQLWLVLWGKMSLVGPRPLPPLYRNRYNSEQKKRFLVYPGVTGYAQVMGRNRLSWEERFRCDVEYVERQSLMLDLKILWQTVWNILFRTHTSSKGDTLSGPFEPKTRDE